MRPRVLIISQNQPGLQDRRVRTIAQSLHRAGYDVTVVSPQPPGAHDGQREIDGVEFVGYRPSFASGGPTGYLREYAVALWRTWRLVRRLARGNRFDVVHVCNPPDFLALAAWPLLRTGTRLVFDHHDLTPELYLARFGRGQDIVHRGTLALERLAFRMADVVVATNDSYRRVALTRGRKRPSDVFVVRNAPDLTRFRRGSADPVLRHGKRHLIAYVGTIAPQDGVDHALRALAVLRQRREDWHATIAGDGSALPDLRALAGELGLTGAVDFAGWLDDDEIVRLLSTADVCLAPDPKNSFNDASTMVKILEYMAMGRPIVSYDLRESRVSASDAATYATPNDPASLAECVEQLLDDPERRDRMGELGRHRVESQLGWPASERALLDAYAVVLRREQAGSLTTAAAASAS